MKGYLTNFNHFKLVECELLDNSESEINQIHMTDSKHV